MSGKQEEDEVQAEGSHEEAGPSAHSSTPDSPGAMDQTEQALHRIQATAVRAAMEAVRRRSLENARGRNAEVLAKVEKAAKAAGRGWWGSPAAALAAGIRLGLCFPVHPMPSKGCGRARGCNRAYNSQEGGVINTVHNRTRPAT
jgi:hypothetical protein